MVQVLSQCEIWTSKLHLLSSVWNYAIFKEILIGTCDMSALDSSDVVWMKESPLHVSKWFKFTSYSQATPKLKVNRCFTFNHSIL